jgi:predicted aspartyl protease
MARGLLKNVLLLAALAPPWVGAATDSVATAPVSPAMESVPATEIPPPAEIKPEDFVYVASTQPDRIGRVMAPVYVNGAGPFAFVVDTGASSSVISPRVVTRLNLFPNPARAKLLRGITGSEVVSTVAVQNITAGEITLPQLELPVVEPRVFADADGIFGADAFARGCLYVDFAKARVSILRTSCPRVDRTWEVVRAKLRFGGLAVVNALVGGVRVIAIIDTGAERSLGNPALLAASKLQAAAAKPATRRQIYAATSQEVFGNIVATSALRIGDTTINNLNVVFGDFEVFRMWGADREPAIVLGMDVLGTARAMMIDYRLGELRLLAPGQRNLVPMRRNATPTRLPQ